MILNFRANFLICLVIILVISTILMVVNNNVVFAEESYYQKNSGEMQYNYDEIIMKIIKSYEKDPSEENEIIIIDNEFYEKKLDIIVINLDYGYYNSSATSTKIIYFEDNNILTSKMDNNYFVNNDYQQKINHITNHDYHNIGGISLVQMLTGDYNYLNTSLNIVVFNNIINY